MKSLSFILAVLLASFSVLACVDLEDRGIYGDSVEICNKVYFLDDGVIIHGSDILFDCNNAVLRGDFFKNSGIKIINSDNVTVKNCNVMHYNLGINIQNSRAVILKENHLIKNNYGTKFFGSEECFVYDADVSLKSPVKIAGSKDNFINYFNKRIEKPLGYDNDFNRPLSVSEERKFIDFTPKFLYWVSPFSADHQFSFTPTGQ